MKDKIFDNLKQHFDFTRRPIIGSISENFILSWRLDNNWKYIAIQKTPELSDETCIDMFSRDILEKLTFTPKTGFGKWLLRIIKKYL